MRNNPERIKCLKNLTTQEMIDMSTNRDSPHAGTHGYWNVFPIGRGEWYVKLYLKGVDHKPFLGCIQGISQDLNRSVFVALRKQEVKSGVRPNKNQIKKCLSIETKKLIERMQTKDSIFSATATGLLKRRSGWYKDRLLTQINHPMMRHVRNMRVSSSLLGSNFDTAHPLPCKYCNVSESPKHFLLECCQFKTERRECLSPVQKLLSDMQLEITPEILLGFFPACKTKSQEKSTRDIREEILHHTLSFCGKTRRFESKQH